MLFLLDNHEFRWTGKMECSSFKVLYVPQAKTGREYIYVLT